MVDPFDKEEIIVKDSYVRFNYRRFIKFFMYHFLLFFVVGPITIPAIIWIEGLKFTKNMGMWGATRLHTEQILSFFTGILMTSLFMFTNIGIV